MNRILRLLLVAGLAAIARPAAALINGNTINPATQVTVSSMTSLHGIKASSVTIGTTDLVTDPVNHTVNAAGKVGIGETTVPTVPLEILTLPSAPPTSGTTPRGTFRIYNTGPGTDLLIGQYNNAPYGTWFQAGFPTGYGSFFPIELNPLGGGVGISTGAPVAGIDLDVNGSAQFGSGVHKATFTASGYFLPPQYTAAQIAATTPSTSELGGIVTCVNCASPYSICTSTGNTIMGFRLGTSGTTACQ